MSRFGEALFAGPSTYLADSAGVKRGRRKARREKSEADSGDFPEAVTTRITRRNGDHLDVFEDDPLGHHERISLRDL